MSPFVVKAIQLLMSLSLLIILHELGHFIPARIFKTRVEKFFLFFDVKFSLIKKKIGHLMEVILLVVITEIHMLQVVVGH